MSRKKKQYRFYRFVKGMNKKKYFKNELEFLDDMVTQLEKDFKKKHPEEDCKNIPLSYYQEKIKVFGETGELMVKNYTYKVEVY